MNKKEIAAFVPRLRFPEFQEHMEWDKKTLEQLGELVSGLTYSPDDIREEGLLVLRSSNIKNGLIALEDKVYVRPDIKGANLCLPNDILICVRNGSKALIGKNALIHGDMSLCTHGAFMTVFRTKNYKFVYQLLQTTEYEKQVNQDLGATINSINGSQLKKYVFFVPRDTKEQQKIADCLSSLDDIITAEDEKLAVLKTHKKGLMQKLFPANGKAVPEWRFPEFRDSGEWESKTVEQISIYVVSGGTPSTLDPNFWNGDIRWMNSGELNYKKVYEVKGRISEEGLQKSSTKLIPKLSVLIGLAGQGKTRGTVAINMVELCINQSIAAIFPNDTAFDSSFLYHNLDSRYDELRRLSTGDGGRGGLNLQIIKTLPICLPAIPEQKKIAACLSTLDSLIIAQTEIIETLKIYKKGLMQGLFPSTREVGK